MACFDALRIGPLQYLSEEDWRYFRAAFERANIDGAKLAAMTDADLQKLADSVGNRDDRQRLLTELKKVKDVCEAQVATMLHFDE